MRHLEKRVAAVLVAALLGTACAPAATDGSPSSPAPSTTRTTTPATSLPTSTAATTSTTATVDEGVDLVLVGGLIVTMGQPAEAEALAVEGNRIVAVGDEDDVMTLASSRTKVVDLAGRVVFPGFIDTHSHWFQPGRIGDYGPEQVNQVLLSRGWTGTNDLNIEPHFADQFFAWHEAGRIALRMNAYLSLNTPGTDQDRYLDWFTSYGLEPGSTIGDRLTIPGVKIFVASDWDRVAKWSEAELVDVVATYDDLGWQIAAKQINDESLDLALAAFEAVHVAGADRRHRLEHALDIRVDQIPRVHETELVPVVQLGGIESDLRLEEGFDVTVSDDGLAAIWPFRDMIDGGLPIVGSMAVAPLEGVRSPWTISVMQMIHGALTGISEVGNEPWPGRSDQLMTVDEALGSITYQAAWSTFEETSRGTVEVGKLADFVIMSGDLRDGADDPEILRRISVEATFIDGEMVWCGFGLDEWCSRFGQDIPERLLDEATLAPLTEGDLGGPAGEVLDGTVTASSFDPSYPPGDAVDGNTSLGGWVAGGPPPGWIEIDLGAEVRVMQIDLWVDQDPAAPSHHRILGGPDPGPTETLVELEGETTWGQQLTIAGDWTVRYLRVETVESTPVFGWLEIRVTTSP